MTANLDLVANAIHAPSDQTIGALLDDEGSVFWVDWREQDDDIVMMCEEILGTGSLSVDLVDADNDAGFEMYVEYEGRRELVPLVLGTEDRHVTLVAINRVLAPDYEVRLCIDSCGSDTLGFVPLATSEWADLESRFGDDVGRRFYRLSERPNVFTDPLPF